MDEFNREASMLSSLNHPNIVHFYGVWKNEEDQYIVCEYMSEGSLNLFVQKNKKTLGTSDLIDMYVKKTCVFVDFEGVRMSLLECCTWNRVKLFIET